MIIRDINDTIVAPATGSQATAIGIVRVSGPKAFDYLAPHFPAMKGPPKRGLQFGILRDEKGSMLDEVVVSFFPGPHSYTKQDTVEISCHGSIYIVERIVTLFQKAGARLAEPGEYTYRAYLNGRMDLTQAEAVTDLIAASSAAQHKIAIQQLKGSVSEDIKILRQKLIDFASLIELELDFGEEDVEFADRTQLIELVGEAQEKIKGLISSFTLGNAIKQGVPIAIIGRPNAGKSTLLNALLNEERAIVSDIPGTTRDAIEDTMNIKGMLFRFIDTAGIRETSDQIEAEGVNRARSSIEKADLVLMVVDVVAMNPEEAKLMAGEVGLPLEKTIIVLNKMDLNPYAKPEEYSSLGEVVAVSARNKMNIEALKDVIHERYKTERLSQGDTIVSNLRHKEAFVRTLEDLERVEEGLKSQVPGDLVAMDIRQALYHMGTITGEISADDLLGNIFSRFCIGK
jgi:tRNA modification GTPase